MPSVTRKLEGATSIFTESSVVFQRVVSFQALKNPPPHETVLTSVDFFKVRRNLKCLSGYHRSITGFSSTHPPLFTPQEMRRRKTIPAIFSNFTIQSPVDGG